MNSSIPELIASREENHPLRGLFYHDPEIYAADLARIWHVGWLFAVHSCELREPGDYVTVDIGVDSLIVLRADDGKAHAFYNVCRHRGTRLTTQCAGRFGKIVCPYHQWVYDLDGALVSCRGMQKEVDRGALGLRPVHLREVGGLVFVSLAEEPPDFDPVEQLLEPALRPQRLDRARVARSIDYDVGANWKIVWENNRECYHCNVGHPQYVRANLDHYDAGDTSDEVQRRLDELVRKSEEKWAACGLAVTHTRTGLSTFPDPDRGLWYSANRTVLVAGYLTESMDGKQVAPLMGGYTDPDVGTLRLRTMPNFWNHSSCDHSVSTRLLPAGPERTRIRVTWLVDSAAEEGKDYELAKLLPFWQLTSEQDWEICERVQLGVRSSGYTPGPFSTLNEFNVDAFVRWYLKELADGEVA